MYIISCLIDLQRSVGPLTAQCLPLVAVEVTECRTYSFVVSMVATCGPQPVDSEQSDTERHSKRSIFTRERLSVWSDLWASDQAEVFAEVRVVLTQNLDHL